MVWSIGLWVRMFESGRGWVRYNGSNVNGPFSVFIQGLCRRKINVLTLKNPVSTTQYSVKVITK